ncbi:unnamed protein product, partial [Owenia fusiformis]
QNNVPPHRTGFTLTDVGNLQCVLFGGVTSDLVESPYFVENRYRCVPADGLFQKLNCTNMSWVTVEVPSLEPRAYHTCTLISKETITLAIIGGTVFKGHIA